MNVVSVRVSWTQWWTVRAVLSAAAAVVGLEQPVPRVRLTEWSKLQLGRPQRNVRELQDDCMSLWPGRGHCSAGAVHVHVSLVRRFLTLRVCACVSVQSQTSYETPCRPCSIGHADSRATTSEIDSEDIDNVECRPCAYGTYQPLYVDRVLCIRALAFPQKGVGGTRKVEQLPALMWMRTVVAFTAQRGAITVFTLPCGQRRSARV